MKKIVAINASPRPHWNTGPLVRDAAEGAREAGDTLQVADYGPYDWTIFDPAAKQARREQVFPTQRQQARHLGAALAK